MNRFISTCSSTPNVRPASDGARSEVRSPHDGRVVGHGAARDDWPILTPPCRRRTPRSRSWSALTSYEREKHHPQSHRPCAHARRDEIGRLMALEQGKPLAQSVSEIGGSCDTIDYYAAEGVRIEGFTNPTEDKAYRSTVTYQPVGVCGLITPWNYPVSLLSWKLGPALATGCTVVVKPTTVTPLSPLAFCAALVGGRTAAGRGELHHRLRRDARRGAGEASARREDRDDRQHRGRQTDPRGRRRRILKKVSLELGGHCPAIVCADADLDLAAKIIAYKGFRNCGQSCSSVNRVYAHASDPRRARREAARHRREDDDGRRTHRSEGRSRPDGHRRRRARPRRRMSPTRWRTARRSSAADASRTATPLPRATTTSRPSSPAARRRCA